MRIRFQADADLNHIILLATVRREPAIDFRTAVDLRGVSDADVLAMAATDGRVLVTHDQRTMLHHFAHFITRQASPGLIVIPQSLPVTVAVQELILIWSATDAEEWTNRVAFAPL